MENKKIESINISGLQEVYDYTLNFNEFSNNVIIIAPNGYGKTAFLSVIANCLSFKLQEAAALNFRKLEVKFANGSRWVFSREKQQRSIEDGSRNRMVAYRYAKHRVNPNFRIDFKQYDKKNKLITQNSRLDFNSVPLNIMANVLDYELPVDRISIDAFRDLTDGERLTVEEVYKKYEPVLSDDFYARVRKSFPDIVVAPFDRANCVFIETGRLNNFRMQGEDDNKKYQEEEIERQSLSLAKMLKSAYTEYAQVSQSLDRTFPSRLLSRYTENSESVWEEVLQDLYKIESKRNDLTEAGILAVEDSIPLKTNSKRDEGVSDALVIYIEDSKAKLAVFDEIFQKVRLFRDLISKKLHNKKIEIGKEFGAKINTLNNSSIDLNKLSSGEKHEFIMLFKLLFETPENSIVLIDEPEISLHVAWQLEFMSDLKQIRNLINFQSIIATHSPQIIRGHKADLVDLAKQQ